MRLQRIGLYTIFGAYVIAACAPLPSLRPAPTETPATTVRYGFTVVNRYPHDPEAFTQGLAFEEGYIFEGTGLRGQSSLRKANLSTGEVVQSLDLDPTHFGEGITLIDDRIIQLTLTSGVGFVYDRRSFAPRGEFNFQPEGWGLTHDGRQLIMSDGSAELRFLDLDTFEEISRIEVTDQGQPVWWLNELEYIEGEIYANVWQSELIARISPETGQVLGWIDLAGLLDIQPQPGVLNGIAYDSESGRLFVTGKNWPVLFEIELMRE